MRKSAFEWRSNPPTWHQSQYSSRPSSVKPDKARRSLTRQDVYHECLIGARAPGAVRNTLSEVILSRVPARIRIETVIGCRAITGSGTVSSLVEPLLHFAVPFASLRAVGIDMRKAALASLIALAPDLDVFFHVHRSESHSIIILAAIVIPLLFLTRNRKEARAIVLLGTFGLITHLVLDLFQNPTPLL